MRRATAFCLLVFFLGLTAAIGSDPTVEVRLSEYAIAMPHTLPAGPTTFVVHNDGDKKHSFKIVGPGIDQMLTASVRSHDTGTLQVTLQPGEYKVSCPIGSHAAKGMMMTLVVTAKQGG